MSIGSPVGNTPEPLLRVQGLKKYFDARKRFIGRAAGQVKAVDGIDLTVNPGETYSLVGESGCGKTTTGRLVLLLEKPTAGQILFRNRDVAAFGKDGLREYRASIQAVFQDPYSSLSPRMRVRSIIAEPLEVNGHMSERQVRERVSQALHDVGLVARSADLYPHEFSSGQRQRIALARALTSSPSLIVLDEPVSALDVSTRAQIMELLKSLQDKTGVAYLLIAHNLATVRHLTHFIAVMYLGKIVESGVGEEVFSRPCHPYTKALFAAALSTRPDGQSPLVPLQGEVPSALNLPPGCRFHPRCPAAMPICSQEQPELKDTSGNHRVACHL